MRDNLKHRWMKAIMWTAPCWVSSLNDLKSSRLDSLSLFNYISLNICPNCANTAQLLSASKILRAASLLVAGYQLQLLHSRSNQSTIFRQSPDFYHHALHASHPTTCRLHPPHYYSHSLRSAFVHRRAPVPWHGPQWSNSEHV